MSWWRPPRCCVGEVVGVREAARITTGGEGRARWKGTTRECRRDADEVNDKEALQWVAMERLPSLEHLRLG